MPSGHHPSMLIYIIVITFIADYGIADQIALRSGTEIALFPINRMPAAPAVSFAVEIIAFVINL